MSSISVDVDAAKRIMQLLGNYLEASGKLLLSIGELEKSSGKSMTELQRDLLRPDILAEVVKRAPPEVSSTMFYVLLKLAALIPRFKDLSKMSPDEKVEVGKELIELSKQWLNVINRFMGG